MKHNLKISVSKDPNPGGVVTCKHVSVREKILRRLFGAANRITVLIPGNSVQEIAIDEINEGGDENE